MMQTLCMDTPPLSIDDLPDTVLINILELLPALTVIRTCPFVCKNLRRLATSADLWAAKIRDLPQAFLHRLQLASTASTPQFSKLWYSLYHTNMLADPNWAEATLIGAWRHTGNAAWKVTLHGGQGWQGEEPPLGVDPWPLKLLHAPGSAAAGPARALASSYSWCEVMQSVNLVQKLHPRGMSQDEAEQYLDNGPELTFSVWCAGRFDCPSVAELVLVLDGGTDVLPSYIGRREFPWQRHAIVFHLSGPMRTRSNKWCLFSHTFQGYGPGVRRAIIVLRGKDERFWAGHYGSKYAAPELHFGATRWPEHSDIERMPLREEEEQ